MGKNQSRPNGPDIDDLLNDPNYQNRLNSAYSRTMNQGVTSYPGMAEDANGNLKPQRNIGMEVKKTHAIKLDFDIKKDSVALVPSQQHKNSFYLTFNFNTLSDVQITIFYNARDILDDNNNTSYIHVDTDNYPKVKSFIFGVGKEQSFPAETSIVDLRVYKLDDLTKRKNESYPLIIKMETNTQRSYTEKKIMYYYFAFKYYSNQFVTKALKEKLQYDNNSYVFDYIYGIAGSEVNDGGQNEKKECAICLTNLVDTSILPCKHMCLCSECAQAYSNKGKDQCPICRKVIEGFLKLEK